MSSGEAAQLNHLGATAMQEGKAGEALELFQRAAALAPESADYLCNVGSALHTAGRSAEAIGVLRRVLEMRPGWAMGYYNLAMAASVAGEAELAMDSFRKCAEYNGGTIPETLLGEVIYNFGNGLRSAGRAGKAIEAYWLSLGVRNDYLPAWNNLGATLQETGQAAAAVQAFQRILAIQPGAAEVWSNLGKALQQAEQYDQALAALRRAAELRPDFVNTYWNLASALNETGDMAGAVAALDRAMELCPTDVTAASYRLLAMHAAAGWAGEAILAEHRKWNDRFAAGLAGTYTEYSNEPSENRRLRIGYVSADFRGHAVGQNILPLIREHDRAGFEIFCYSSTTHADALTGRFRELAEHWREIGGLGDAAAAERVREDGIDILVDLSLHSAGNRLLMMARKPAPVQVTFAGYPGTTGVGAIDYRLTDAQLDPEGNDRFYSEESIRLPHSFWCYDWEGMSLAETPAVGALPAERNGFVTFGCLNKFGKVNEASVDLWGEVMAKVAGSRLILLAPEGAHRERVRRRLEGHGISGSRVEFRTRRVRKEYMGLYDAIDVGLDTTPYGGHTTSLDAAWMGAPVVTLVGETAVQRAGLSHLVNLGLPELAAKTPGEFVEIAAGLAGNIPRLKELRQTMRERLRGSALMDAKGFARGVEEVYRLVWGQWIRRPGCRRVSPRSE